MFSSDNTFMSAVKLQIFSIMDFSIGKVYLLMTVNADRLKIKQNIKHYEYIQFIYQLHKKL